MSFPSPTFVSASNSGIDLIWKQCLYICIVKTLEINWDLEWNLYPMTDTLEQGTLRLEGRPHEGGDRPSSSLQSLGKALRGCPGAFRESLPSCHLPFELQSSERVTFSEFPTTGCMTVF